MQDAMVKWPKKLQKTTKTHSCKLKKLNLERQKSRAI